MVYNLPPCFMKKTLLLAFALILSVATFAQQQLATLNHNDQITVFYGLTALQNAYAAADTGDIITLSPGNFNSVNITKPLTIRGAGMFADTEAGTERTILLNAYTINVNHAQPCFYMEGVSHAETVTLRGRYLQFEKCYFKTITGPGNNTGIVLRDASFVNCIIEDFKTTTRVSGNDYVYLDNTQFTNSVILNKLGPEGNHVITNCVAQLYNYALYLNTMNINNSILYYSLGSNSSNNAYSSHHCIGINTSNSNNNYYSSSTPLSEQDLHNYKGLNTVFVNFDGTSYTNGVTDLNLTGDAANILGSDNTQIGIYGGIMPFDPKVRNPLIGKVTVAPQSTSAGELQVEIELKNNSQQ